MKKKTNYQGGDFMKKLAKKMVALVAAMVMVLAMGVTAFAQTNGTAADGKGSITINNPTKGQTYTVYKLFDATLGSDNAVAYSTTKDLGTGTTWFSKDSSNNVSAVKDADITTDAFKTWAESFGTQVASVTADGTSPLTFQGLDYGYYYVKSSLGAAVAVNTTTPNVVMNDKNTTNPGTDASKKIVTSTTSEDGTTTTTTADATTAKIGDTVNYQITFTAQNYDADNNFIYNYVITDTPTGLDIDTSTLQYSIVKGTGTNQYDATNHAATVSKDSTTGVVTITLPWGTAGQAATETTAATQDTSFYDTPAVVTITYSAKLTATTGSNKANVKYNDTKGNHDTNELKVYTAEYDLTKVDSVDTTKTLTGAEFDLYDAQTNGTKITVSQKTQDTDGAYVVDPNGTATIKTGTDGKFTIEGLKQGTKYYLEETKAPDGYTKPTSRIELKAAEVSTTANTTNTENVTNTKGTALPTTGGMGTTIFYVLGAILVIGAGVVLVTRRRVTR